MVARIIIPTTQEILRFINNTVLSGSQSTIDISGIPQNYTDLHLILHARCDVAASFAVQGVALNGDFTGVNYRYIRDRINNGAVSSGNNAGSSIGADAGTIPANSAPAGYFGHTEIVIKEYSSPDRFKIIALVNRAITNTSVGNDWFESDNAQYLVAAAINRITFTPQSAANYVAGCNYSVELHGKL